MSREVTLRLEAYTGPARQLIATAQGLADEREHPEVEPLHLLYRLVERDATTQAAVREAGADPGDVLLEAESSLRRIERRTGGAAYLSPRLLDLLGRAEGEAARSRGAAVDVAHLLLATAQEPAGPVRAILRGCGLSAPVLRAAVDAAERGAPGGTSPSRGDPLERFGRDLTRLAAQGRFDPTVGRDAELRRILQVLSRRHENNPLLVGEHGVGKDAIVHALATRIARGDVPTLLRDKRLLELDVAALAAGARLRGELEERVSRLLDALRDSAGRVILYVSELGSLFDERLSGAVSSLFARALRDSELRMIAVADPSTVKRVLGNGHAIARQFVRIDVEPPTVAETVAILRGLVARFEVAHGLRISDPALTTAAELAKRYVPNAQLPKGAIDLVDEAAALVRVERDSVPASLDRLERRLENVRVQLAALADDHDPDSEDSRAALEAEAGRLEPQIAEQRARWHRELALLERRTTLKEEREAAERELAAAEAGADKQRTAELRFGTLVELDERLAQAEAALAEAGELLVRETVTEEDVAAVVSTWTGVPVSRMLEGEAAKLLDMEQRLGARVIGQPEAVRALSRAVRRGRVGLRDERRPIGSFLFLGSTGVGKTELAKALAELLFDDEASLTRLDMSEFMEKHTVARLIGSPPGYVDSEEGGFLTEAVRRRPYSVLLFDEIEKAHPDVFNILLQVLDDGRLTDSRGRLAHFADTVIILTSNIGAHLILEHQGRAREVKDQVFEELARVMRPEFLNRIDDIVLFEALDRAALAKILDLQLARVARMLAGRKLTLEVSDAAKAHLVDLGYDPAFGARPLRRALVRELQDPLAEQLLRGGYAPGSRIHVELEGDTLRFA